ncbi:MAG TPA: aminoacyl-tRNA hydrolase [Miltoncostaeaceae bacterium]|nr:aminoacyl-tRNA hydrolase [Miltoncostaeaceae bacterium]
MGLGNPGSRYARTRHNAGQVVVERVAARLGAGRAKVRYAGYFREARGPHGPLGILIPTTYMNDAGRSVGPAAGALGARPHQVLVVHDELDLPFGAVRGKAGGGAGGHNGVRSVIAGLGTGDFLRVRLGIGRPPREFRGDEADWVLMPFGEPAEEVEALLATGVAFVESVLEEGMDGAIARFHAAEPGSRARARRERRDAAEPEVAGEDPA